MGCDFRRTQFADVRLNEALLDGCRFDGADRRGASLGGLRLKDAGLLGARRSCARSGQPAPR
ncbi:pentapeptide repeat-containing protein [Sphingomonas sp. MMS24-JH45]